MEEMAAYEDVKVVMGKFWMCDMICMFKVKVVKVLKEKKVDDLNKLVFGVGKVEKKKEMGFGLFIKRDEDFGAWYS